MTGEHRPLPKFRQLRFAIPDMVDQIDWTRCPDVDRDPGKDLTEIDTRDKRRYP